MTGQLDFDAWRSEELARRRNRGLQSARRGDPDGFDRCVEAIRHAAAMNPTFTTDAIHRDPRIVFPGPELGSAFRHLHEAGEIEPCGFEASRRPESHGRIVRIWRAAR